MRSLGLVLLVLVAGCSREEGGRLKPGEVLLQVSATGRAEARPDEAKITVGVTSRGATSSEASAANNATMSRIVAALDGLGVKGDDVMTRSLTLQRIDYGPERGRFRAENLVDIRLRDVTKAGAAVAAATEAGGNVVSGPELRLVDPEKADNAAYAAAYKAARARAEAYAEAADLEVRRVLTIRDGGGGGGRPMPYEMDGAANLMGQATAVEVAAPPPPVMVGEGTRIVRVRVDFALK